MNWFYEKNQQQNGPVSGEAIQRLIADGVLTGDNLVWREGMEDWVPCSRMFQEAGGVQELQSCPHCGAAVNADALIPAGEVTVCPSCREEYLQRLNEGVSLDADSEMLAVRNDHIKHEASVKSVGLLYYLGAFFTLFGGVSALAGMLLLSSDDTFHSEPIPFFIGVMAVYLLLGILMLWVGRGFRKLRRWVRIPGTIFSGLGLISFPIGTLINGYILYLIWSQKGKMVFSPEYQEVIQATPEVKYKSSPLVIAFLILLVVILLAAIIIPAAGL